MPPLVSLDLLPPRPNGWAAEDKDRTAPANRPQERFDNSLTLTNRPDSTWAQGFTREQNYKTVALIAKLLQPPSPHIITVPKVQPGSAGLPSPPSIKVRHFGFLFWTMKVNGVISSSFVSTWQIKHFTACRGRTKTKHGKDTWNKQKEGIFVTLFLLPLFVCKDFTVPVYWASICYDLLKEEKKKGDQNCLTWN